MWILVRLEKSQPLMQVDAEKYKHAGSSSTEASLMQNNTKTTYFDEAVSTQIYNVKFGTLKRWCIVP